MSMFFALVVILILATLATAWLRHRNASRSYVEDPRHPYLPGVNPAEQVPWDGLGPVLPSIGTSQMRSGSYHNANTDGTRSQ